MAVSEVQCRPHLRWCLGYIPKWSRRARVAGGCPNQAIEAMVVLRVVQGLFGVLCGLDLRAVRGRPPFRLLKTGMHVRAVGGAVPAATSAERTEYELEVRVVVHGTPIQVRFAPFVGDRWQVTGVTVLGEAVPLENCRWENAGAGHRLVVDAAPQLGECVLRISLRPLTM